MFSKTKSSESILSLSVKHSNVIEVVLCIIEYLVNEEEIMI